GIFNNGAGTIRNCTIAGNSSPNSTGGLEESGGSLNTGNTIIAGNAGVVPDISGNLGSQGYNLIGDGTGGTGFISTDLVGVNPLLSPLGDYAGPTATVALLPGSPAIDAGNNDLAVDGSGNPLSTDQRGFTRIVNGTVDIGAFESHGFAMAINS